MGYAAQHTTFPCLHVEKATWGAAEKFIMGRPFPDDWRLLKVVDAGPGGIIESEITR